MRTRVGLLARFAGPALIGVLAGCWRTPSAAPPPAAQPGPPEAAVPASAQSPPKPTVADATPFAYPQDDLGRWLQERLAPAEPMPLPEPTPAQHARAASSRPAGLDRLAGRATPPTPPAPPAPRLLAADKARPVRLRPTVEPPRWDSEIEIARPTRAPLPATPRAYVAAPDPDRLPIVPIATRTAPARPGVAEDATLERSREEAIAARPALRSAPVPSAHVSIPDPDETLRAARIPAPPPDDDPPAVASRILPQRPPLPTQP